MEKYKNDIKKQIEAAQHDSELKFAKLTENQTEERNRLQDWISKYDFFNTVDGPNKGHFHISGFSVKKNITRYPLFLFFSKHTHWVKNSVPALKLKK